jgi:diguanylate cyclase (GGDEF)-like protein
VSRRESLVVKLRRALRGLALSTLVATCLALSVISFLTLRAYVDQNLRLVARSMAYTAQAAVVFHDSQAAQEILTLIARQEGVWQAELFDEQNQSLARYQRQDPSRLKAALNQLASAVIGHTISADIEHEKVVVGRIGVVGDFTVYLWFFLEILLTMALCFALIAFMGARLSGWFAHVVVSPLDQLANLTRTARINRNFEMRAPSSRVAEINALSEDFNALLEEIHGHERELLARQHRLLVANEALSHQAFHDGLTELPNRTHFLGRLANALAASGPGQAKLAVMYIDCDHFKQINDSKGHAVGDEVLIEFALRLRAHLREGDAVARLGGDEFAAMLTHLRSAEDVQQIASNMINALAAPIFTQAGKIHTSATIGVAIFPDHGDTLEDLLRCADSVMYRAKGRQRGSYLIAEPCDLVAITANTYD